MRLDLLCSYCSVCFILCLFVRVFVCLFVCLCVCLFVRVYVCLFASSSLLFDCQNMKQSYFEEIKLRFGELISCLFCPSHCISSSLFHFYLVKFVCFFFSFLQFQCRFHPPFRFSRPSPDLRVPTIFTNNPSPSNPES